MMQVLKFLPAMLLLAGSAAAQTLPTDTARRLPACLELARTAPAQGLAMARSWEESGGGIPARRCTAMALLHKGEPAAAATRFAAIAQELAELRADPLEAAALYAQAGEAWKMAGDYGRAVASLTAALKLKPADDDLTVDRAVAYALNRQYWEAIQDLDGVIERRPRRLDAYLYRAGAHRLMGSNELALDDAERAVAIKPTDPDALLERGNSRRVNGNLAGAEADWKLVLRLDPDGSAGTAAKTNLARLQQAK